MAKRDIIGGHKSAIHGNRVATNGFDCASPLHNLYANETIEHHDDENRQPRGKKNRGLRVAGERCQMGRDVPYRCIIENDPEEHPVGSDRTPKLSRTIRQRMLGLAMN
jgi:hypothetical protein